MMARALGLAVRGLGTTSPNPMVGAVLASGGRVLAEGHHSRFGGPHAERRLLAALTAGRTRVPSGSVLYLTLEPCTYHGKTPPCVDALIASPIRRAVVAARDPNPIVTGRGLRLLRRAGWEVRSGLMAEEARRLNLPFLLSQRQGRARITLKIASTLDGALADHRGFSRWITGVEARRAVGTMRAAADAIVVGRGTVDTDDPRLRTRAGREKSPSRIVIDSRLAIDPGCRLARVWHAETAGGGPAAPAIGNWVGAPGRGGGIRWIRRPRLIVATSRPSAGRGAAFVRLGWEVWRLPDRSGGVDLLALAGRAAREGLIDLLVEPGPLLAGSFLDQGPVDRIALFLAPKILGGDRGWSARMTPRALSRALLPHPAEAPIRLGGDLLLRLEGPRGRALVPPRRRP
jgi:diaminohydroxyphosphoribosylaminopyrimidine deaminase / 5-amino-6-(5-phosphoribosylamino)uracil reductase